MEKLLGDHMLKGWILLADNCPKGCNVPLVQQRQTGLKKCVQCSYEKIKHSGIETIPQPEPIGFRKSDTTATIAQNDTNPEISSIKAALSKQLMLQAQQLNSLTTAGEIKEHLDVIERLIDLTDRVRKF